MNATEQALPAQSGRTGPLEWTVRCRPLGGAMESGDACIIVPTPGGVLAAVVDGLGHGVPAAKAASAATELISTLAGAPLETIFARCHIHLHGTRGVVASLAAFDEESSSVTWAGVGNVEGVMLRRQNDGITRDSLTLRGGVLGGQIPKIRCSSLPILPGDLLILTTDGIRPGFAQGISPYESILYQSIEEIADGIVARFARSTDDVLVLVSRWRGGAS